MGRIASSLVSLMLFLSAIGFLSNIQSANASSNIYIRPDGRIEPSTADILTFDNATYVFTDNIFEGIVVERSNITLDGNGYKLKGSGTGIGILLSGEYNITIKGMTISDFDYGISIDSPSNIISGNNVTCGILVNSAYNTISNNVLDGGPSTSAIWSIRGSATTIVNNDIKDLIYFRDNGGNKVYENRITGLGIVCEASSNNIIQRNLFFACRDAGIALQAISYSKFPQYPKNNLIVENEIIHCPTGISLDSARSTTIHHNNLINNTIQVSSGFALYTIWDNDYPSGGNYWSDYVGSDLYSGPYQNETGADGIGDTQYLTNANDRYPLIERHNLTFWQTQRLNPEAKFTATVETSRPAAIFDASASKLGWNGTHLAYLKEYTWQFGDGNTTSSTSASITHIYPSSGTYAVSLTVTDNQGLKGSSFGHVSVVMPTTVSVQTTTPSSLGFKVGISGTLQDYYGNGLENQEIVAYYTFSGIDTWIPITSDYTDSVGNYSFEWIPSATGYFTINISWNGNITHLGACNTVSYAVTTHEEYFIAVESNSTISELFFDVQNRTLIFKATGQNSTDSYTRVSIPKILVSDINKVEIFIDGVKTSYNSELLQDSCIFEFIHTNSFHEIEIKLPLESSGLLGLDLWVWVILVSAGISVAIATSILILKRRKS